MNQKSDREKGVDAIIDLQWKVGIKETRERAEEAWDKYSESQRQTTMAAWRACCK